MKKLTAKEKRAQDAERKRRSQARLKEAGNTVLKVTINKEATEQFQQIMEHIRKTEPKATKGQVVEVLIQIGHDALLEVAGGSGQAVKEGSEERSLSDSIRKALSRGVDIPKVP